MIKCGLVDLENEIEKIPEKEIEIENPYEIVHIVERILYFNNKNKKGQRLKILTLDQILSRLPITLAQWNAGNNSEKLKNKIKQLPSFLLLCIAEKID